MAVLLAHDCKNDQNTRETRGHMIIEVIETCATSDVAFVHVLLFYRLFENKKMGKSSSQFDYSMITKQKILYDGREICFSLVSATLVKTYAVLHTDVSLLERDALDEWRQCPHRDSVVCRRRE